MTSTAPDEHEVIGREVELASLRSFLDQAADGPAVLVLDGEAGIGKTTLWEEAIEAARSRSYRILSCRPVESEAKLSFAALGDLLAGTLEEALPQLPVPQAHALEVALLIAEPDPRPPDTRAVALASLGVLRALAATGPVIVAVDDVQWLDGPTSRVLEFVVRRLESESVGILVSLRSSDDASPEVPLLLDRSVATDRFHRVTVGPMEVDALGELLRVRLGEAFLRPTLVRLHEMTGGNPFFAFEIARASIRGDRPATGLALPVPQNLREVVRQRLETLPEDAREALLLTSALSAPTMPVVSAAMRSPDATPEAMANGVEAGVIQVEGDRIRFTHPLFGSGIYSDATSEERRAAHRRLAAVTAEAEERARHLALGAEGPDAEVAAALDQAAERAASRGAADAAAELADMAIRLTPGDQADDVLRRTLRAGNYRYLIGDTAGATRSYRDAVTISPPGPERARALHWLGMVVSAEEGWVKAAALFREALPEAGDDAALRAGLERGLAYADLFAGRLADAEEHARAALDLDEGSADPEEASLAESLQAVAFIEFMRGRGIREDLMERALALEPRVDMHIVLRPSHTNAQMLKAVGRLDEARAVFEGLLQEALDNGWEGSLAGLHFHLTELECRAGNWAAAADHARAGETAAQQIGQKHFQAMVLFSRALLEAHLGNAERTRSAASEGIELAERTGLDVFRLRNLAVLGFLEFSLSDFASARRYFDEVHGLAEQLGIEEPTLVPYQPDELETLIALGELDRAEALLDAFEEEGRRLDRAWAVATASRCRGLLLAARGDLAAAIAALDHAVQLHGDAPEPFARGRTLLALGTVQRRAKQKAAARRTLGEALDMFERLGARLWEERARQELARIGGRTPAPFALTPTEELVAALVAAGQTNREVADALFMSVNTVEWNLSKIYRKLGVRSRSELASKLAAGSSAG